MFWQHKTNRIRGGFVRGVSGRNSIDQYKRLREVVVARPTGSVTDRYRQVVLPHPHPLLYSAPSLQQEASGVDLPCLVEHSCIPTNSNENTPVGFYVLVMEAHVQIIKVIPLAWMIEKSKILCICNLMK